MPPREAPAAEPPKFLADAMLGRLARWLRLLGFDAAYDPRASDATLIRRARAEGRILLTRDTRLLRRRDLPLALYIRADDFRAQVREVVAAFDLGPAARFLSRCGRCNAELVPVSKALVRARVPPYVFASQSAFAECPCCHRIYWSATHVDRMRAELDRFGLPGTRAAAPGRTA